VSRAVAADAIAAADLFDYTVALADDALVLGQRLAEWVSNAPTLEEELALANVALDHIGRARMFYARAVEVRAEVGTEDDLAYGRDATQYRNLLINELPRGDFAFTIVRQFFVDAFNVPFLDALTHSADAGLAAIAGKAIKESTYHLRRSRDWMLRLGDGTDESHARTQRAIDHLACYCRELFEPFAAERRLIESGVAVDRSAIEPHWRATVDATLRDATLSAPRLDRAERGGRDGVHTEHLAALLSVMQTLQRTYPGQRW
jgi:ring-1,2-phenylacetyl-CoA epoxidase subunit PaaC